MGNIIKGKNKLPYKFIDTFYGNFFKKDAMLKEGETNDCVVRALAVAFDVPYDRAHHFARVYMKRRYRKGAHTQYYFSKFRRKKEFETLDKKVRRIYNYADAAYYRKNPAIQNEKGIKELGYLYEPRTVRIFKNKKLRLKQFMNYFSYGTYLVLVKSHVFAVKDGAVYGNYGDAKMVNKTIKSIYRIL